MRIHWKSRVDYMPNWFQDVWVLVEEKIIFWFQDAWARSDEKFGRDANKQFYEENGVNYYFFRRPKTGEKFVGSKSQSYDDFIGQLAEAIADGEEIYIALGEMGNMLMEHPLILQAIQDTKDALIQILHGPHVDPYTRTVFQYADQGILAMYQTREYVPDHFILVKQKSGQWFVADENPHSEGMWRQIGEQIRKVYRSIHRTWYVLPNSQAYWDDKMAEFENRKANMAEQTNEHPGELNNYNSLIVRIIQNFVSTWRLRFLEQPKKVIHLSGSGNEASEQQLKKTTNSRFVMRFVYFIFVLLTVSLFSLIQIVLRDLFRRQDTMIAKVPMHPTIKKSNKNREVLVNISVFFSAFGRLRELEMVGDIDVNIKQSFIKDVEEDANRILARFDDADIRRSLKTTADELITDANDRDEVTYVVDYADAQREYVQVYIRKMPKPPYLVNFLASIEKNPLDEIG